MNKNNENTQMLELRYKELSEELEEKQRLLNEAALCALKDGEGLSKNGTVKFYNSRVHELTLELNEIKAKLDKQDIQKDKK